MKIAIIGYGIEGQAAYDYWRCQGDITICDQQSDVAVPNGVTAQLGNDYLTGLDAYDVIVRSPFVRPDAIVVADRSKITSCTNEFLRVCPTRNIIGITGTKGKGTTSTLTARMLEAAGKRVHLGGNIGVAALSLLKNDITPDDWVVLELSSFQLIDIQYAPHIACCLMIAPEHLDWHDDVAEYYTAKQQLFAHQAQGDIAVYYGADQQSARIASASNGSVTPYYEAPGAQVLDGDFTIDGTVIAPVTDTRLLGEHNWQNVCAALTVAWQVTQNVLALRSAMQAFTSLEHRLELVRDYGDVQYYDDSFGTTPETAIVAVRAFERPKVLILGGSDKGANYGALAQAVTMANVRQVLLIGDQAEKLQVALEAAGFYDLCPGGNTMTAIVNKAQAVAQPGDVVLLSTGCASFGMFNNYKDRGDQFKQAVRALV